MERLRRIDEIKQENIEKPAKEEEHTIRWRGRKVIIRKNAPYAWCSGSKDLCDEEADRSPIQLLLSMINKNNGKES